MSIDIEQARKICNAATKAPWRAIPGRFDGNGSGHVVTASDPDWRESPILISHYYYERDDADLTFIAFARSALPAALDEIERLDALLREACELAQPFIEDWLVTRKTEAERKASALHRIDSIKREVP